MPRTSRLAAAMAALLLLGTGALFSQTISEKEEVAVFRLSTYRWDIPNEVLGGIDEEIRAVFINIGRFDVIGLTQRLEEGDVNQFIDRLKQYKERSVELSQDVQMGREFFTQADFDRLTGSFVVVVPTVASYVLAPKDGEFKASIKTSFTFINVEKIESFAQFFVETSGTDKTPSKAILKAIGLKAGEIDAMEGSPPCASFSTAGKREKHWGKAKKYSDTVQRTDDLFFEYVRLIDGLKPRAFVAENVSGLVKGVAKGWFLEILAKLKACGYRVECRLLDAQWLGVPQARQNRSPGSARLPHEWQ